MSITFRQRGDFSDTTRFLTRAKNKDFRSILERYAVQGVSLLSLATPKDSGLTADSWRYEIKMDSKGMSIYWTNNNVVDGVPVAILIQYGHGTRSGTFVPGRDFINPAMRPLFDQLAETLWKEVNSL